MKRLGVVLVFLLLMSSALAVLPADLPASIPLYPEGGIENLRDTQGDEKRSLSFGIIVDASLSDIYDYYEYAMARDGWSIKSDQTISGYRLLQADNGELYTGIQAVDIGNGQVRVSQQINIDNTYNYSTSTPITNYRSAVTPTNFAPPILPIETHHTSRSPLRSFLPGEVVPLVASGIGLGLLWFWKKIEPVFLPFLKRFTSLAIAKKIKKKSHIPAYKGFDFHNLRIKYREWAAVGITAIIFALALSFSFSNFFLFFLMNILVNILVFTITTLTRLFMDKHFHMHREYKVWWWGALVTVLTGWLGNTFSLAGYIISDKKEAKNPGMVNFIVSGIFTAFSLVFLYLYHLISGPFLRMSMVLMLTITTLDMLPFAPFNGKSIYSWSKKKWMYLFIPLALLYFFVVL